MTNKFVAMKKNEKILFYRQEKKKGKGETYLDRDIKYSLFFVTLVTFLLRTEKKRLNYASCYIYYLEWKKINSSNSAIYFVFYLIFSQKSVSSLIFPNRIFVVRHELRYAIYFIVINKRNYRKDIREIYKYNYVEI